MKIHAFTLSWNGLDKLKRLQPNLYKNVDVAKCDFTWHIRDNGSKDNTINEINWGAENVYGVEHNRDSFAKGMNFLFEQAKPKDEDIILLLNNDVIFNDDFSLKNMINLMDKTSAAIVGCKLCYPDRPEFLQHAGVIFSRRYGMLPYHYRPNEKSDDAAAKNRWFQAVTAACCLAKVSSWKRVGGMSERYKWAFEDIDFCLKIGQKEKIAYCGKTNILHEESATLKKNPVQKMFMSHNVKAFKDNWWKNGKPIYELDHDKYLKSSNYNEINV